MTKTRELAEKTANEMCCMTADERIIAKLAFEHGSDSMLARVLDFMRTFQNRNGEFPLYDYIGNVRKAMED